MIKSMFVEDINGNLHNIETIKYVYNVNDIDDNGEAVIRRILRLRYYPDSEEETTEEVYKKLKSHRDFIETINGTLVNVYKIAHASTNQYGNMIRLYNGDEYFVSDEVYKVLTNHTL